MKKKKGKTTRPVSIVSLMFVFSNVVADMKRMTISMEKLAKKLDQAVKNGTEK